MSQNEASGIVRFPLEEVKYSWKITPGGEIKRVFTCDFWKDEEDWKKGVDWRKAPVSLLQKRSEEIDEGQGHVVCLIGKLKSFKEDGQEAEKRPYVDSDILQRRDPDWNGMDWDEFVEKDPRWIKLLSTDSGREIYNTWIIHQFDPHMGAFEPFSGAQAQRNAAKEFEEKSNWLQLIRDNAGADFPPLGEEARVSSRQPEAEEEIKLD